MLRDIKKKLLLECKEVTTFSMGGLIISEPSVKRVCKREFIITASGSKTFLISIFS